MKKLFIIVILLKLYLSAIFSSDYSNVYFVPFIENFIKFGNPWEYGLINGIDTIFPFQSLMLYIYSFFIYLSEIFPINSIIVKNIFFKLPSLISDIVVFHTLTLLLPGRDKEIFWLYFCSPIILYVSYIHSQLDLLPIMFLVVAFYNLKNKRLYLSSLFFGLACATKLNVLVFFPISMIYILKEFGLKAVCNYLSIMLATYFILNIQFLFSPAFHELSLFNEYQNNLFDLKFPTSANISTLITPLILIIIYLRFFCYEKINMDLFDAFLVVSFLAILITIPSMPGWHVWSIPFLTILIIKYLYKPGGSNYKLSLVFLNLSYLIYFIFFHQNLEINDVVFLSSPLSLKIDNELFKNLSFTFLQATLIFIIYITYKFVITKNLVYSLRQKFLLCISGDSGSGKTYLAKNLNKYMSESISLEGDAEHKWERGDHNWDKTTHLNPKANLLQKQFLFLDELKRGNQISRRDYSHELGSFTESRDINPSRVIILSGLHSFYLPKTRLLSDLKVFLDTPKRLKHGWKIVRDKSERNYDQEEVLKSIENREGDFIKFVFEQKKYADIVINYDYEDSEYDKCIMIEMDSNIDTELLIEIMNEKQITFSWDYSPDGERIKFDICISDIEVNLNEIFNKLHPGLDDLIIRDESKLSFIDSISIIFILNSYLYKILDRKP